MRTRASAPLVFASQTLQCREAADRLKPVTQEKNRLKPVLRRVVRYVLMGWVRDLAISLLIAVTYAISLLGAIIDLLILRG